MKIIILTLSPAREAFEWRSLLDVWDVDLPLTSVRVCLFDTMRFYLCLMSQTLLSLESASIKFNPNKLCCTIFLPSPAIQIENRRRSCPANLKCLFKRGCACVCARVHVCVLMNDSLGQDHKYPCWTAAIAFFFFFCRRGLIPLSKTLQLFSNGNLFNKSVSCEGKEWLFPSPHLEIPHPPPENTGWCEAVEMGEKKVGHLLYMEQPERQDAAFNCSTFWAHSKPQNHCSLSPWTVAYINKAIKTGDV